jgi:hypothetical protein
MNALGPARRSYFGGRSEATARSTVARPIPNCLATCRRGTPSATSRLINAQSSTEITHPICLGGLIFDRRYGLVFKRCRQTSIRCHPGPWTVATYLAALEPSCGPSTIRKYLVQRSTSFSMSMPSDRPTKFGRQVNLSKRQTARPGSQKAVLTRSVTCGRYWI